MSVALVCVGSASLVGASAERSIYYGNQKEADVALAVFENDHPKCEAWANWQKMCYRNVPKRDTVCFSDPKVRVKPSIPFCIGDQKGPTDGQILGGSNQLLIDQIDSPNYAIIKLQVASANRFCAKYDTFYGDEKRGMPKRYCVRDVVRRPFNSRNVAITRSPLCKVWRESKTYKPVCAEGILFPELSRCSVAAKVPIISREQLYCSNPVDTLKKLGEYGCLSYESLEQATSRPLKLGYPTRIFSSQEPFASQDQGDGTYEADVASTYWFKETRFSQIFCGVWGVRKNDG
ncbi:MAG: hypothetical protein ACKVOJ_11695 [Sphingomonadaceae bacterium]